MMQLNKYSAGSFLRGKSAFVEVVWLVCDVLLVRSWLPGSTHRRLLLRLFGARIGRGVVIKPRVQVKFPWRLSIGDHSWIGEGVWLDNLADISIGAHCCISQGAYLCTGNHDWSSSEFKLITAPITLEDRVWISAKAVVGPGVVARHGVVLSLGSVASGELESGWVYRGVPAVKLRQRDGEASDVIPPAPPHDTRVSGNR